MEKEKAREVKLWNKRKIESICSDERERKKRDCLLIGEKRESKTESVSTCC